MKSALASEDFNAAMGHLATQRGPTDAFFEQVTVNADDANLRANRLKLLGQMTATISHSATQSKYNENKDWLNDINEHNPVAREISIIIIEEIIDS